MIDKEWAREQLSKLQVHALRMTAEEKMHNQHIGDRSERRLNLLDGLVSALNQPSRKALLRECTVAILQRSLLHPGTCSGSLLDSVRLTWQSENGSAKVWEMGTFKRSVLLAAGLVSDDDVRDWMQGAFAVSNICGQHACDDVLHLILEIE